MQTRSQSRQEANIDPEGSHSGAAHTLMTISGAAPTPTAANSNTFSLPGLRPQQSPQHPPQQYSRTFEDVKDTIDNASTNAVAWADDEKAYADIKKAYKDLSKDLRDEIEDLFAWALLPDETFRDACDLHRRRLDSELERDLSAVEMDEQRVLDEAFMRLEALTRRMAHDLETARVSARRVGASVCDGQGAWWRADVYEAAVGKRAEYLAFVEEVKREYEEESGEILARYGRAREALRWLSGGEGWDSDGTVEELEEG
ncbi:hypothetical protein B0T14DRAFT_526529 [Immersiella caudata]|uniref:Uncharacterized protein n=1 Tax=Immersiella caudata TaxID=314043 RepID=A0AA39WDW5_9PEZI|nr:hypothetical protein B0T14DRAFT_526529 [Immersiella caudata]